MLFFGRQYPLNFGFKVGLRGPFDPARARSTLVQLSLRHTALYAHQEYTTGKDMDMVFDYPPPVIFREVMETSPWKDVLLSLMVREFDCFTGPLFSVDWRRVGAETELYFVFQHGAADGIAAVYFIHDFLSLYAGLPVEFPRSVEMPVLYDVMKDEIRAELLTRPEPDWKKEEPPPPKPFDMPAYKAPDFYLRLFEMSPEATTALAVKAKAVGQTVNSYLGALALKASAAIFAPEGGWTRTFQCPVDFRQYLKEEYRSILGVYNGIVKVKTDCGAPVEAVAEAIRAGVKASRDGYKDIEEYFQFRDSFDGVPDAESLMMGFDPDVIDYDFSFSNLGRTIIAPEYGDIAVSNLFGPIFTAVSGETVIGLNTTNGSLRMSLIFDRTIPKAARYEALGDRIAEILAGFEPR